MSNAAFVLMNCDLVAVPLQLGADVVTVYCGQSRARELLISPLTQIRSEVVVSRSRDAEGYTTTRSRRNAPREVAPVGRR